MGRRLILVWMCNAGCAALLAGEENARDIVPYRLLPHNNLLGEEGINTMTTKYSNGYPDPSEPNVFPLEGYAYGFTFSVMEAVSYTHLRAHET